MFAEAIGGGSKIEIAVVYLLHILQNSCWACVLAYAYYYELETMHYKTCLFFAQNKNRVKLT